MMIVHLVMFVLYMATLIGKTISISGYITSDYTKDRNKSYFWYIVNIWFEFFDELILGYLFIRFS
jgi:hypothetical protein